MKTRLGFALLAGLLLTACPAPRVDAIPPEVTITSPEDEASVAASTVTVTGSASDNVAVTELEYQVNGEGPVAIDIEPAATVEFEFEAPLQEGANTITVTARDEAGNEGEASVTVTREGPEVTITSPEDGAQVDRGSVDLSGTVNEAVTRVEYTINDSAPVTAELDADDLTFSADAKGLVRGENVIEVFAFDANEGVASDQVTVVWPRDPEVEPIEEPARVRVMHGSPDAPAVDWLVDGEVFYAATRYKEGSPYIEFAPGAYVFTAQVAGTATTVIDEQNGLGEITLEPDTDYTLLAIGEVAAIEALALVDPALPAPGSFNLLAIHAAPGTPDFDVYLTEPGGSLEDPITLEFGDIVGIPEVPEGFFQMRMTPVGDSATVIYDSGPIVLEGGINYAGLALDSNIAVTGASPLTAVALTGLDDPITLEAADVGLCPAFAPNHELGDSAPITPGDTIAAAICLGEVNGEFDLLPDYYSFTLAEGSVVFVDIAADALGSDLNSLLVLYDDAGEEIDFNFNAGPQTSDSSIGIALPAGTYHVSVEHFGLGEVTALPYELSLTTEDPQQTQYEATAGTFNAASNDGAVGDFEGNVLVMSVRSETDRGIKELVGITVPGVGSFPFTFDPAFAIDNVIAVVIADFGPFVQTMTTPAQELSALRRGELELQAHEAAAIGLLRYQPTTLILPQQAVGGEFVFEFADATVSVTVDEEQIVDVAEVTGVDKGEASVTVEFAEVADMYELSAYGRISGAAGRVVAGASPAEVALSGPLLPDEPVGVSVLAGEALYTTPLPSGDQLDLSEYLFVE